MVPTAIFQAAHLHLIPFKITMIKKPQHISEKCIYFLVFSGRWLVGDLSNKEQTGGSAPYLAVTYCTNPSNSSAPLKMSIE